MAKGARLNCKGNVGDVTDECPSAWIGCDDASTVLIFPNTTPWNVAVAPSFSRLILAVNGLASVKVVKATPVFTISRGNTREALLIKV